MCRVRSPILHVLVQKELAWSSMHFGALSCIKPEEHGGAGKSMSGLSWGVYQVCFKEATKKVLTVLSFQAIQLQDKYHSESLRSLCI